MWVMQETSENNRQGTEVGILWGMVPHRVTREELCEIREKETKRANVLVRNLDEVDNGEDGGWKDDKKLVEYLVHMFWNRKR